MIHIVGRQVLKAWYDLDVHVKLFQQYKDENPAEKIVAGHCQTMSRGLQAANEVIQKFNLPLSKNKIDRINDNLGYYPHGKNVSEIYAILQDLQADFVKELMAIKLAFIPASKEQYFEEEFLFGQQVYEEVHKSCADLKDAGNCIAADLHTAAVFHLMRIVEIGLRELANDLGVKVKKTPLDYAGWESVVKAIDDKLAAKLPKARGPKKTAALKFKQDLLADFKSFEVTRNEIMHCRWRCNEPEAMGVYMRVRDFMQRLAGTLKAPKKRIHLKLTFGTPTQKSKS
jgi:hypothetical protein